MEITTVNESERYGQALLLHQKIMASGNIVQQALVDICRDLKTMRDEKLYKDLGFESFDSYCEEKVGLKARQAYTYISTYERLGAGTIKENAELGITKLSLLSSMNPVDRAEALDSGEEGFLHFEGMLNILKIIVSEIINKITGIATKLLEIIEFITGANNFESEGSNMTVFEDVSKSPENLRDFIISIVNSDCNICPCQELCKGYCEEALLDYLESECDESDA